MTNIFVKHKDDKDYDLHVDLMSKAVGKIRRYTVPLTYNNNPAGSGTLVRIGESYGILTASHVVHPMSLTKGNKLGIVIRSSANDFFIPCEFLTEQQICAPSEAATNKNTRAVYGQSGPDITFIRLPVSGPWIGQIKAHMGFWNIDHQMATSNPPEPSTNLIIIGYPESRVSSNTFTDLVLWGRDQTGEGYLVDGNYDYLSVLIQRKEQSEMPAEFKGMSGGAVWSFTMNTYPGADCDDDLGDVQFCGVIYYEEPEVDRIFPLRCHFHQSIMHAQKIVGKAYAG